MKRAFLTSLACLAILSLSAQDSLGVTKLGQFNYTQGVSDVWGYSDGNGREFALVGLVDGFSIVEVTNPAQPVEKHFIPGANSIWRDIKTWGHHAYVVHDAYNGNSDGILIVDMNTVDNPNISFKREFPMITVGSNSQLFDRAHNIYIDENGVLYTFGGNTNNGSAVMYDLTTDPEDPTFLGAVNSNYYHDGVVRGDTLWGCAIYTGEFEVVDVSNKTNAQVLASQGTPNSFTHNIWFSDDNQTVFTTDERTGAFVTSYDVSDLSNITELDRIRTSIFDPAQVIPHNVHVYGNFLVTSYYTSGVQIVDASRPDILVETAYYDTSPLSGNGFEGAWGAYPYLPSGHILVSDRQEGLFVLQSDYPRASYFTAFVKDSVTNNPLVNAQVEMLNADINGNTNIFGNFRDGQRDSGVYQVVFTKAGYHPDTISVHLQAGVTISRTVALLPQGFSLEEASGTVAFQLYPNPSTREINLQIDQARGRDVEVYITDMKGQRVFYQQINIDKGTANIQHGLPEGLYLCYVNQKGYRAGVRKLIVADQP